MRREPLFSFAHHSGCYEHATVAALEGEQIAVVMAVASMMRIDPHSAGTSSLRLRGSHNGDYLDRSSETIIFTNGGRPDERAGVHS